LWLAFLLMIFAGQSQAQTYQFSTFGLREGLKHESTYAINQGINGFLWISTTEGICRFDGIRFTSVFQGDTLPESVATTSFLDRQGRMWFGFMDGSAAYFQNNRFHVLALPDSLKSSINAITEDQEGKLYLLTQRTGLISVNGDMTFSVQSEPFEGLTLSSLAFTEEGNLLLGTFDGLSLFIKRGDDFILSGDFDAISYTQVQVMKKAPDGSWWIGTADEGLFRLEGDGENISDFTLEKIGVDQGLDYASVSSLVFESNGRVWISDYGMGVYRFNVDKNGKLSEGVAFNDNETGGLPDNYIKEIFIDSEGNHWFASQGHGIAVLRDQAFLFYDFGDSKFLPDITALITSGDYLWLGGKDKIVRKSLYNDDDMLVINTANGLPKDIVTALYMDEKGDLWIGTAENGLYRKKNGSNSVSQAVRANNSLENNINALDGQPGMVWAATNNCVYSLDVSTMEREKYSTTNGLPHNLINDVFVDREGKVWIATRTSGLVCMEEEYSKKITGEPKLEFLSMVEDNNGNIWAGTNGDGVFMFGNDTLVYYSTDNGLRTNFCYAMGLDVQGNIWVGHRLGLSKINPSTGHVTMFDKEGGFTSDVYHNSIASGKNNKVYFGTNDGLIIYDADQAREDTIPPKLSITDLRINDVPYDFSEAIKLPYGVYKIRIDFVGINMVSPEQVSYQYSMEGYDDWSEPTTATSAYYSRIEDGDFTFKLKACDGSGNCNTIPLELKITVKIPIWKAWWFILSMVGLLILIFFIILKIRERNQKAIQEYLQQQLDERTREVVLQKEEIENKNRDITDSINYAQRIQASILPPIKKLHETFSGSFVFYQPRDIVSGDFYWYDKLDENRFIIVCADSTGHGVPGAFMSMIGTTLIKDICLRPGISTPSDVLTTLDREVREALNQNIETSGSNDGMDIIVAEIDLSNYRFRVSSAMRPVIIYKNGEQIYVKGSRSSIGGQINTDDGIEKEFVYEEYQLSKGDIVYMFSDGYPDQFGGPLGRKFKMVRLKNLLRDIHDKPMEEQYNYIKSNFFLWKEDLDQVDDVLFMGIKI